jgi:hypothetical protein
LAKEQGGFVSRLFLYAGKFNYPNFNSEYKLYDIFLVLPYSGFTIFRIERYYKTFLDMTKNACYNRKMSKGRFFFKTISETTALGMVFASSLYCNPIAASNNSNLLKKTSGFFVWGNTGCLFAGRLFRRILPCSAHRVLSLDKRIRTLGRNVVSSRNDILIRFIPKPAVNKLRRGQQFPAAGPRFRIPGVLEQPHIS